MSANAPARRTARARRLLAELTGKPARQTIDHILRQIDGTLDGVELAARMAQGALSTAQARDLMSHIERRGDAHRASLVRDLGRVLTTPIDREDLYRLSRSVGEVLDNLRDFVRESDLYGPATMHSTVAPIRSVGDGLCLLRQAVAAVIGSPSRTVEFATEAREYSSHVRDLYQDRLGELFDGAFTMEVFKTRELLRRLDVVALRLGEAANALSDGMLKRSL